MTEKNVKGKVSVYIKDGADVVFLKVTKNMDAAFKLIRDVNNLIDPGSSFIIKEVV